MDAVKRLFLPWRHDTQLMRWMGTVNLYCMAMALLVLVDTAFVIPLLAGMAVFCPLLIVSMVKNRLDSRRSQQRLNRLIVAQAVSRGVVELHQLPPRLQEDVKVEFAAWRLSQERQ